MTRIFCGWILALTAVTGCAAASATGPIEIRYELENGGEVSAAVYDDQGLLVRTLLRAEPHEAGEHTMTWDGLNRLGEPQEPGSYEVRILRKPAFRREFVMQVGVNPDSQPWHRWVGDFGGGTSVAVDASGMYVSSRNSEGSPMLLKQSLDGRTQMWHVPDPDPWRGGLSLASDGETVYVLQQNGYITLFDAETGRHTGRWDVLPEGVERKSGNWKYTDHTPRAAMDLAVRGDTIVVTDEKHNQVRWLNGEGKSIATVNVPSPRGVAIATDGTVYVASNQRVVAVDRTTGDVTLAVEGLANPWRLTAEPVTGDLLVVEGPDDWRIKRFTAAGEHKATYGREGGRRDGPYEPTDFLGVTDLTADGAGGFLVAESELPPRRVARFDEQGKVIDQWYGGLNFFAWRSVDPRDPTKVWYQCSSGGGMVLAELDYENRTWRVLETHRPGRYANGLPRGGGNMGRYHVRYHEGERYLVGESFPPMVFRHEEGQLKPVVIGNRGRGFPQAGTVARIMRPEDPKAWIAETLGRHRRKLNTYLWTDQNGDHTPQAGEISLHKLANVYHGPGGGAFIASDFSVVMGGGDYNPNADKPGETKFYTSLARLAPSGWVDGVPQYDLPRRAEALDVAPMWVEPMTDAYIGRARVRHTYRDDSGSLYAFYDWGGKGLSGFPNDQAGRYARVTRWSADGKRLWSVGRKSWGSTNAFIYWEPTDPGEFHDPAEIAGEVRDTIVVCDRVKNPGMAWTKDGLFAGSFFPGRVDDGLPEWVYAWQNSVNPPHKAIIAHDCLEGGAITEHNGKVYFLSPGRNSIVVYRVHGYDTDQWTRMTRSIELDETPAFAKRDGTGLNVAWYSGTSIDGEPDAVQQDVALSELALPNSVNGEDGISLVLSGQIEAPLSEAFTFQVRGWATRMWIDGRKVMDFWNQSVRFGGQKAVSAPIALQAGQRVNVRIELSRHNAPKGVTDSDRNAVSFLWASRNTDPDDIPGELMYPAPASMPDRQMTRPATDRILVRSHDQTISSDDVLFDNFHRRHYLVNWDRGEYLGFRGIDFGAGLSKFKLNVRTGHPRKHTLEVRLDAPDGPVIAEVTVDGLQQANGQGTTVTTQAKNVTGVHDVYLVGTGRDRPRPRWFSFE